MIHLLIIRKLSKKLNIIPVYLMNVQHIGKYTRLLQIPEVVCGKS